jgi:FkbM family methyltransferase
VRLGTTIERLWLRALPPLTRDYLWVSIDGLRIYGAREHQVMLYWLLRGKYERHTRTLFEQAIRPGMRVLDIGAHIGYFTLLAARAVGQSGSVYAFEPDPANFRFLSHNAALNGVEDVVTAVPQAVAGTSGVRPFFSNRKNSVMSSFWGGGKHDGALRVECTTVDDFVGPERIDVVKLDVEGAEVDALRGMRRTLTEARRPVLIVECNPTALATAGASVRELLDELAALELDVRVIDEKQRDLLPVTDDLFDASLADGKWYANLYCTRGGD